MTALNVARPAWTTEGLVPLEEQARRFNGHVLNGAKTFITNGRHANPIIVVAKEGQGFAQLMNELPRERLIVATHAMAMMEGARWSSPSPTRS